MIRRATILASLSGALCVAALAVAPAAGASGTNFLSKRLAITAPRAGIGSFTPAAADPVLAAALARSGLNSSGFRFTPAAVSNHNRAVTVAVRARVGNTSNEADRVAAGTPATLGIAPVAYSLGVGVGFWCGFWCGICFGCLRSSQRRSSEGASAVGGDFVAEAVGAGPFEDAWFGLGDSPLAGCFGSVDLAG